MLSSGGKNLLKKKVLFLERFWVERNVEYRLNYAELLREKVFNLVYAVFAPCTWTPRAFV